MTYTWGKPEEVVAQRFLKKQLPGMFTKQLIVKEGETCLVEKDARVLKEFTEGTHTVSGLFGGDLQDIILVDITTKALQKKIKNLLTKDDDEVNCDLDLKLVVYSPEKFARNLMINKNLVTLEDLYLSLYDSLFTRVLAPIIRKEKVGDLYGNTQVIDKVAAAFEVELKKTLETWGVELADLNILWEFSEDYLRSLETKKSIKRESEERDVEHEEELKEASRKEELESFQKGSDLEKAKADIEIERVKREVDIELSRKESAEDEEEALEGLDLMDIKRKQKKVNNEKEDSSE